MAYYALLDAERFGLTSDAVQRRMHVLTPEGQVLIGIDALAATWDAMTLFRRMRRRRTSLKAFLMDQRQIAGLGNIYVSDRGGAIFKVTPAGDISTLAGALGQTGSADGPGATARFNGPAGIAVDASGNVFVADSGNATIRKITSLDGVVTVSTFAGAAGMLGSSDGAGGNASFAQPWGVATDDAGNVYVADPANNNVRKISAAGSVTTLAGHSLEAGSADGLGAQATFNKPLGIALDGANNVYVADTNNHTLRAITPAGVVSTIAGTTGRRGFGAGPVPGTLADPVAVGIGGSTIYLLINNGVVTAQ